MLQERNNYAIIGYKYVDFLEELVNENIRFILGDGPVSVSTFQSQVESLSNDSNYIDWLLFDVSYIDDEDYTECIRYLKTICNSNMRIMVIDPFSLNKKTAQKLISYGVFDIVTLLSLDININSDEDVLNELQFQIEQLDLNPRDFAEGQEFLSSLPEQGIIQEESTKKKGFSLFGRNKKEKTKKIKKNNNTKRYTISCISYDDNFRKQLIEECEESEHFKYEIVNSRIVPEYIDILIFDGDFDESDIAEYEIGEETKLFIFRNNYLEDEYEDISFANFKEGDEILPYLTNNGFETKKQIKYDETLEKEKKRRKINPLLIILPLLLLALLSAFLFTPLKNVFHIFDKKPIITLTQETVELGYKEDFDHNNYILLSNMNENYKLAVIDNVKQHEIGEYVVDYQIIDNNQNTIDTKQLKVNIIDNIEPTLTLENEIIEIENLSDFKCKVYVTEATDEIDGDIKSSVKCDNTLQEKERQDVIYSLEDKSGNKTEKKITVVFTNYKEPEPTPTASPTITPTPTPSPTLTPTLSPTDNDIEIEILPMQLKVGASKADIENTARKAIVKKAGSGNVTISIDYSKVDTTKAGKYEIDFVLIFDNDEQLIKKGTLTVSE